MVHDDKASDTNATQENEEIDRIMQQIEDLEKKMEQTTPTPESSSETTKPTASSPLDQAVDNVVSLRAESSNTSSSEEATSESSLVESDASPVSDQPLLAAQGSDGGNGNLSLKVGGCTDISLEFEREGVTIHLACTSDGLTISTDQGAEFRLPFKRLAA